MGKNLEILLTEVKIIAVKHLKNIELERFLSPVVPRVGEIWYHQHYGCEVERVEWFMYSKRDSGRVLCADVYVDGSEI